MTSYHGGKQRIGKKLAEVIYNESMNISEEEDFEIKGYCEPFCGMLGVYRHIPELFKDHKPKLKYKAGDINESLIKMWKAAKKGWSPPINSNRKKYYKLKDQKTSSAEKGFVGHAHSFRGLYFSSFFSHKKSRIKHNANKVIELGKILKKNNVNLSSGKYNKFSNLKGYIIYCDPPYEGSAQIYRDENSMLRKFNHKDFFEWCNKMSEYNIIFLSSYKAPKNFIKVYSKSTTITGIKEKSNRATGKKPRIEKLYLL